MSNHTDSYTSVHNEDGTITTTEISTFTPPTSKEKAIAYTGMGLLLCLPFVPIAIEISADKWRARREARKAKKTNTDKS